MSFSQMLNALGGFSFGSGNDCVIYTIAFATGRSYEEVYDSFGDFYADKIGMSNVPGASGIGGLMASNSGINLELATEFANSLGLNSSSGLSGNSNLSSSGNMTVVFLDNGNGNAVVVTAHDGESGFYYHDPQNGSIGTITANAPRIKAFLN